MPNKKKYRSFRKTADKLFSLFGENATVILPTGPGVFDPHSGDTVVPTKTHKIRIVDLPLKTDDNSDFGLSKFQESKVTFYVVDNTVVVNETGVIEGIDGVKWGIVKLNSVKVNGSVVVYEALAKAAV